MGTGCCTAGAEGAAATVGPFFASSLFCSVSPADLIFAFSSFKASAFFSALACFSTSYFFANSGFVSSINFSFASARLSRRSSLAAANASESSFCFFLTSSSTMSSLKIRIRFNSPKTSSQLPGRSSGFFFQQSVNQSVHFGSNVRVKT